MSVSKVWANDEGLALRVGVAFDIPATLTTRQIDQVVTMATCRLRFLLAQEWRRQTHEKVTAKVAARKARKQIEAALSA